MRGKHGLNSESGPQQPLTVPRVLQVPRQGQRVREPRVGRGGEARQHQPRLRAARDRRVRGRGAPPARRGGEGEPRAGLE